MTENSSAYIRSHELLSATRSQLLIVDMQQKLLPHIPVSEQVTANCRRLLDTAKLFEVPSFTTEQYPRGLGATTEELAGYFDELPEKLRFSCAEVLNWNNAAERDDMRDQLIIAGIESHVCVLQTAFDFLAQGYRVVIPADAVGSRKKQDWKFALQRLADGGAVITTTESVLFEWCEVAGTEQFKQMTQWVK